jgi:prepilin-type N-terminal cleavage/methylation domain-containing protein
MKLRRGFTLIEVLIAATILFAGLAVVSYTFSVNAKSARTAAGAARAVTPVPQIVAIIRADLRDDPRDLVTGQGSLLGVDYSFKAMTKDRRSPPDRFDPDRGNFVQYPQRFRLYEVELVVRTGDIVRRFNYSELAWTDQYEPN